MQTIIRKNFLLRQLSSFQPPINATKPLKISDFVNVYYKFVSVCFY